MGKRDKQNEQLHCVHFSASRPNHSLPPPSCQSVAQGRRGCRQLPENAVGVLSNDLASGRAPVPGSPTIAGRELGTRSFLLERFFQPEDAVARIRQTAEGLYSLRDMLDTMAWRYVIFYIRQKSAYLSQALKNAATTLLAARPLEGLRQQSQRVGG